jgi:hypothetical protein
VSNLEDSLKSTETGRDALAEIEMGAVATGLMGLLSLILAIICALLPSSPLPAAPLFVVAAFYFFAAWRIGAAYSVFWSIAVWLLFFSMLLSTWWKLNNADVSKSAYWLLYIPLFGFFAAAKACWKAIDACIRVKKMIKTAVIP